MNSEQTYELEVITTVDLSINFEDIYKAVSEEIKTNDTWEIQCAFGDNMEYYLWKLYGDKLGNAILGEYLWNKIADDFEAYVQEHYGYEDE